MDTLIANLAGQTRRATLSGREYLVAPLTMIRHGVLAGSNGPLYYPPEEYANGSVWNHMPIVVRHPVINGKNTTARRPDILNQSGIGFVFDAHPTRDGQALVAEGWFDIEATRRVDNRIYDNLVAGRPIELSTGLKAKYEKAPSDAVYNGTSYTHIVRAMEPDHLAVLPDEVGACSLKDGCGVHVTTNTSTNVETYDEVVDELPKDFLANSKPGEAFTKFLDVEGKAKYKLTRIKEPVLNMSDKTTIWQTLGKLLGITNNVGKDDVQSGSSTSNSDSKEPDMAKLTEKERGDLVTELTANCSCWDAKKDKDTLNALSDDKLKQLVEHAKEEKQNELVANAAKKGFSSIDGRQKYALNEEDKWEAEEVVTTNAKGKKGNDKANDDDEEEITANLSPEQQAKLDFAERLMAKEKNKLISKLTANVSDKDKPAKVKSLSKKSIEDLEEMLEYVGNAGPEDDDDDEEEAPTRNRRKAIYSGQGANSQLTKEEMTNNVLLPPSMDYDDNGLQEKLAGAFNK